MSDICCVFYWEPTSLDGPIVHAGVEDYPSYDVLQDFDFKEGMKAYS